MIYLSKLYSILSYFNILFTLLSYAVSGVATGCSSPCCKEYHIYIYIYIALLEIVVWSSQPPPQAHRFCIEIDLCSVSGIILINRKLFNSTSNVCWRRASLRKFRFESEELKFIATPISIGMSEFTWKATCLVGFHWRYFPENSNLPPYGHFPPNFISQTSRGTRRCRGWPIAKPDGWCYFPM